MAPRITRTNSRTGHVERPWRNRDGQFVLADPVHGAHRHHDKFAVKVGTLEEVAALIARGFSVRMTDGESPPSLISPDSFTVEEVADDPASLYIEMSPKPPFEKTEMMEELKQILLVQANQIAHAGRPEYAVAFMGFQPQDYSYPYTDNDEVDKVDLRRFFATEYLDKAYDYAFQVGRHHLFDGAAAQNVEQFIMGANPSSSDGRQSPLANPESHCRVVADTAIGRWNLEEGYNLSVRNLALLAQMTEPAVRNSLSKERIAIGKEGVDNAVARTWLRQRRDFVPTRTQEATQEHQASWFRFVLDHEDFGTALQKIMESRSLTRKALADKARVREALLASLLSGRPVTDVEKLQKLGEALELNVPHFVGTAIKAALRTQG